ncbi:large conductance mechanosensitive channel protein MscL [Metamycoplasma buccale]|uniref:large conductance mechanosensitive channel protein MscL n=1 Tax=Metamycoplasma buccale TaxID=55602 RepID=UPI00398EE2D7
MTKKELEQKSHYVKNSYKDAKKAVMRGNMFMLAIGLLLGAAFGAVVSSLANDVIMAAIAKLFKYDGVEKMQAGGIYYGKFLAALIQFIIVSLVIFFALLIVFTIKNIIEYNKAKKQPIEEEVAPAPTNEELILAELKKLNENISLPRK